MQNLPAEKFCATASKIIIGRRPSIENEASNIDNVGKRDKNSP